MEELISLENLNSHHQVLATQLNKAYSNEPSKVLDCSKAMMLRDNKLESISSEVSEEDFRSWINEASNQDWSIILMIMGYAEVTVVDVPTNGYSRIIKI